MKLFNGLQVIALSSLLTVGVTVQAQKRVRPQAPAQTRQSQGQDSLQEFRKAFIKSSEDYKASLQKLLSLYEDEVKKVNERSTKWEALYKDGLISRKEYETSTSDITAAQAKVDEVRKQIATAEITIAEAQRQPGPDELRNAEMAALSRVAPPWTTGNSRVDGLIRQNGARYGVDPYFIYCVIRQESSFSTVAVSSKGAQGLMQLMPGTAARYGVMNVNDPAQNIMGGTRYLRDLLQLFHGRIDLVLAGYNAGEGAVIKYGQTIPPYKETQDYVRLIGKRYLQKPKSSPANKTTSPANKATGVGQ
jgi:soluble lytic murein transglycosylase-like protein